MGCRSDYMEPDKREVESRKVAGHLVYVFTELKQRQNITNDMSYAFADMYGNPSKLDEWTALLCSTLRGMSHYDIERIVYNAKSFESRNLADWWERHQEWDKKREADEAKKKAAKAKRESDEKLLSVFNALPPDERKRLMEQAEKFLRNED